jgi:putative membrane protein
MKEGRIRSIVITGMLAFFGFGATLAQTQGTSTKADRIFLTEADEGNSAEIAASQMALKKAKDEDVKTFAQQMITDHQKLRSDMAPLAQKLGVTTPQPLNPTHKAESERLASLSGSDFDKEYIKAMDLDHHKMLGMFKNQAAATTDADLKAAISQGETAIQHHTEMADQISQKLGVPPSTL